MPMLKMIKNPRRELILTGIYAINLKLKYGAFSLGSRMLILWPRRILGELLSFVSRSVQP